MRTVLLLALLTTALMLAGCSSGESYVKAGYNFSLVDKVAIIDVQGDTKNEIVKNQIAHFFNMELLKKGYTPVERADIQALLKEQEFQSSELTSQEGMARAGQVLNVPVAMLITVPKFGEEMSVTAKMTEVETGSIIWMASGTGNTGRTLGTIFGAAVGAAVGAGVSGEDDRLLGAVVGGVAGGVAGRALSPQAEKHVKKIIGKMCETLPARTAGG